jgi:hypothetical protein
MGPCRPAAIALAVLLSCLVCDAARGQEELELKFRQAGMAAYGSGDYSLAARDFRVARFLSLQAPARHLEVLARLALAEDAAGTADVRDATLDRFFLVEARFPEYAGASLEPDVRSRFHSLLMKRIPRDRLLAIPPLAAELGLTVQDGDMVVELRAEGPDKGGAVEAFMAEPPFAGFRPVFVGDDLTDEHGFAAARARGGFGVVVGARRPTAALYALSDVGAVQQWLRRALERGA